VVFDPYGADSMSPRAAGVKRDDIDDLKQAQMKASE
jgi:hypothetical protein